MDDRVTDDARIADDAPVRHRPQTRPAIHHAPPPAETFKAAASRRRRFAIFGAVLLVAAAAGGAYWWSVRDLESTDDAIIDGDAVAIQPRIEGTVARVAIDDNQAVKAGALLVEIDPATYEARLADARAAVGAARAAEAKASADLAMVKATAQATLHQAQSNVALQAASLRRAEADTTSAQAEASRAAADAERYTQLGERGYASKQRVDQAKADSERAIATLRGSFQAVAVATAALRVAEAGLDAAQTVEKQIAVKEAELASAGAAVQSAEARRRQAELDLSYTKLTASHDGTIVKKAVSPGAMVRPGQTLASLVYGPRWVTANFKETQLSRMRPGQKAEIRVDAYPGVVFQGHVDSIQRGTGAFFSLLPAENATGNFVKVVQRVPVKIVFDTPPDPTHVLSLGMSVVPSVNVGGDK
jgi:membrane fusion protein (multidrug efflux system)